MQNLRKEKKKKNQIPYLQASSTEPKKKNKCGNKVECYRKKPRPLIFQKNSRLPRNLVAKGHNSWLSYVVTYYIVCVEITLK